MAMRHIARARQRRAPARELSLVGFRLGLNTATPASEIDLREVSELVNLKLAAGGKLEKRPGIQRYSSAAVSGNASITAAGDGIIGSTRYEFLADENRKLYYLDGSLAPVLIGTLAGTAVPVILAFNGVVLILDGSYIKYLDDVTSLKILYDDGTGNRGYQFDNRAGSKDTTLALGNGTNTRVAYKFTSQSWDAGFTIPPTSLSIALSKTGTPSATAITARIRKVSDDSILAEAQVLADATALTSTAEAYTADFTVTNELSPSTNYYLSIEHSGGDASNYVNVHCTTVSAGGHGYHYDGSSWTADATADPVAAVKPGRPPQAKMGLVWGYRCWVVSDAEPGGVYYSSYGHKDWSTPGISGWVGAIDEDASNYPVGGIGSLYGDLMIYGTRNSPYICRLSGSDPSDFAFNPFFQRLATSPRLLVNVVSDLWSVSADGIAALSGVQEYGDLRPVPVSNPIKDRMETIDVDTAFAGYYNADGQFWLVQPEYHRVLVSAIPLVTADVTREHRRYPWMEYEFYRDVFTRSGYQWTKSSGGTNEYYLTASLSLLQLASGDTLGLASGGALALSDGSNSSDPEIVTAPDFVTVDDLPADKGTPGSLANGQWGFGDNDSLGFSTIYYRDDEGSPDDTGKILRSVLVPTCLAGTGRRMLVGGSDGYLYTITKDQYLDQALHSTNPRLRSAYIQTPFRWTNLETVQLLAASRGGIDMTMSLYINGASAAPGYSWPMSVPVSDDLTLGEATAILADAGFAVAPGIAAEPWTQININAHSFQLRASDIKLYGPAVYLTGWRIRYRPLQK